MSIMYPTKINNAWSNLVVGGADLTPIIGKISTVEMLGISGSFESEASEWSGGVNVIDVGRKAFDGSFVQSLNSASPVTRGFASGSGEPYYVIKGFVKFPYNAGADAYFEVKLGNLFTVQTFKLKIKAIDVAVTDQWVAFYMIVDNRDSIINTNWILSLEYIANGATGLESTCWVDGLKLYGLSEIVLLENPCNMSVSWEKVDDASYTMSDGTDKTYVQGFRPNLKMSYGICTAAELAKQIDLSEQDELFISPNSDSSVGFIMRWDKGFDYAYFHDKMFAHSNDLSFKGIFLSRYKNREYGNTYFEPSLT